METHHAIPGAGELLALGTSLLWALSVALFRPAVEVHGARTVNLTKCGLAAFLQGLTALAMGQLGWLTAAPTAALVSLGASGLVGLMLGDTALFGAVARIGVSRTLLLQTLAPLFTALLAAAWGGEWLDGRQLLGGLVILAGVAVVVAPGSRGGSGAPLSAAGVGLGVLAALGQGAGIVLAKSGMEEVPVVAASFFRLSVAAVGLLALAWLGGRLGRQQQLWQDRAAIGRVVPATLLGTYLALFLMMASIAWAPAAVAAVLLSTSPIFGLVLESLATRRLPPVRGIVGSLVALVGVALLTVP